jgi:hypothetical protein
MNAPLARSSATTLIPTESPLTLSSKWKAFHELVKKVDEVACWYEEELCEHRKVLFRGGDEDGEIPQIYKVEIDKEFSDLIRECRDAIALLDPTTNYDEDGLTKGCIKKRLAIMLGAFPSKEGTGEGFVKLLLEHVALLDDLNYLALEGACRELETGAKFQPAIAEVISTITKHVALWQKRRLAINDVERLSCELMKIITRLQPGIEAKAAAMAAQEATSQRSLCQHRCKEAIERLAQERKREAEATKEVERAAARLADLEMKFTQAVHAELAARKCADEKAKLAAEANTHARKP